MNGNIKKQRVVVKIGSSSLTNSHGGLSQDKLNKHVKAIVALRKQGHEVLLVSSGAVATGFTLLGYPSRPATIEGKQAAAAVGQGLLIQAYNDAFSKYGLAVAQILITRIDFSKRQQYNNVYNTLSVLLKRGIIPIINENDTVAIDELTFGDNDMLSALVAGLIHADTLVILTDADGLYDSDPRVHPHAKKFKQVDEITPEIEALATASGSSVGTGGMKSKILATKLALSLGVHVFIGTGNGKETLTDILEGKGKGTYFGHSLLSTLKSKKQWIAFHSDTNGQIIIDEGAAFALIHGGKSLLPAGVTHVDGNFLPGEVVEVYSKDGHLLGKGLINYSSAQLKEVQGNSTEYAKNHLDIERIEVIHRDDWVALQEKIQEVVTK
ncbi:glutamate 5-kinase 1 [Tepidibacillus sp. HK-1]|nr:glutamate 5-kinase 1 [Tepidibacillus sp. HK-1]